MGRTNISVDESVADALSDEATRENKTLYALANEALGAVLQVCKDGGNPREIHSSWKFARILRDIDSIPLPGDLVEKLIKKLFDQNKDWLLKSWFEEGARLGAYLRMYVPQLEALSGEIGELQDLLPVKRIELQKVETSDREVQFVLRAIGAGLSYESTNCAEQFIRGVISSYSYHAVNTRISEGMIEIRAIPEKKASS